VVGDEGLGARGVAEARTAQEADADDGNEASATRTAMKLLCACGNPRRLVAGRLRSKCRECHAKHEQARRRRTPRGNLTLYGLHSGIFHKQARAAL
jgi:hypothetical protein